MYAGSAAGEENARQVKRPRGKIQIINMSNNKRVRVPEPNQRSLRSRDMNHPSYWGPKKSQEYSMEEKVHVITRYDPSTNSFHKLDLQYNLPKGCAARWHALHR